MSMKLSPQNVFSLAGAYPVLAVPTRRIRIYTPASEDQQSTPKREEEPSVAERELQEYIDQMHEYVQSRS